MFFFFNDTATTEIYTLSLHDALPISRWVAACARAKGIAEDSPLVGEEWGAGAWPVLKNMRLLRQALVDIEAYGRPRIPGPARTRPDGQVRAQGFPQTIYDRLSFTGITVEVWMEPGVTVAGLPQ